MTLRVLAAGPLLSVQDPGRPGLRRFGVSAAGPMDPPAMQLANALCHNPDTAAVLEFAGLGGRFHVTRPALVAVTGGDCDLRIDDRPIAAGESHRLMPGETLFIGALRDAVWGYLGIAGGIVSPPVLGARSTHLRSGLGGLGGRRLIEGDVLPLGPAADALPQLRAATPRVSSGAGPVRVVLGPQHQRFAPEVLARLVTESFIVSAQRDRMAMVLDGPRLPAIEGHDIVSDGTVPGAIQVPGSGQPIVLMAEAQTTGGYPKIATVIGADLARLAQMPTGSALRFAAVTRDQAEEIWIAHCRFLRGLREGLRPVPDGAPDTAHLLSCDLVGLFAADEILAPVLRADSAPGPT